MSPRLLGISVAILGFAFILALPEAFEGDPANQVDAIRFGPRSQAGLGAAQRVRGAPQGPPGRRGSATPSGPPAPAPLRPSDSAVPGEDEGGGQAAGTDDGDDDARPGPTPQGNDDSGDGGGADDDGRPVRPSPPAPPPPATPPPVDDADDWADDDDGDDGDDLDERVAPGGDEAEVDR